MPGKNAHSKNWAMLSWVAIGISLAAGIYRHCGTGLVRQENAAHCGLISVLMDNMGHQHKCPQNWCWNFPSAHLFSNNDHEELEPIPAVLCVKDKWTGHSFIERLVQRQSQSHLMDNVCSPHDVHGWGLTGKLNRKTGTKISSHLWNNGKLQWVKLNNIVLFQLFQLFVRDG